MLHVFYGLVILSIQVKLRVILMFIVFAVSHLGLRVVHSAVGNFEISSKKREQFSGNQNS